MDYYRLWVITVWVISGLTVLSFAPVSTKQMIEPLPLANGLLSIFMSAEAWEFDWAATEKQIITIASYV